MQETDDQLGPPRLQLQTSLTVEAVPAELGDITALVGGGSIICGIRKDADTACVRQLGLDGWADPAYWHDGWLRDRPHALEGLRVRAMSANTHARCIIPESGDVKCWGPVLDEHLLRELVAPPLTARAISVAVGGPNCVIDERADLLCWGSPPCRPHGSDDHVRHGVQKIADGARAVAIDSDFACFLALDGTVHCWGHDEVDGNRCRDSGAMRIVPGLEGVVQIALAQAAACALTEHGDVKCWGSARDNLLGVAVPPTEYVETPISVEAVAPAVKISGFHHVMCALKTNGEVWCWGIDIHGREADLPATKIDRMSPAIDILATENEACALMTTREVRCFPEAYADRVAKKRPEYESREAWVNAIVFHLGKKPEDDW